VIWKWHNVDGKGDIPSPRFGAKICVLGNKLWLIGGSSITTYRCADLFAYDFGILKSLHSKYMTLFDVERLIYLSHVLETQTWENLTPNLSQALNENESVGMICPYSTNLFVFLKSQMYFVIDTRKYHSFYYYYYNNNII
jgi:hypothetical protein